MYVCACTHELRAVEEQRSRTYLAWEEEPPTRSRCRSSGHGAAAASRATTPRRGRRPAAVLRRRPQCRLPPGLGVPSGRRPGHRTCVHCSPRSITRLRESKNLSAIYTSTKRSDRRNSEGARTAIASAFINEATELQTTLLGSISCFQRCSSTPLAQVQRELCSVLGGGRALTSCLSVRRAL